MVKYFKQGWLVLVLALAFGGALAGVEAGLSGRISENKKNETYGQIPSLLQGAAANQTVELDIEGEKVYAVFGESGQQIGWMIRVSGMGFADRIEALVGLDASAETITGVYVLDQKETPGLGSKIASPSWIDQFAGKPADGDLTVVKGKAAAAHDIQAISGATISSDALTKIINQGVRTFRSRLDKARKALAAARASHPAKS